LRTSWLILNLSTQISSSTTAELLAHFVASRAANTGSTAAEESPSAAPLKELDAEDTRPVLSVDRHTGIIAVNQVGLFAFIHSG